MTKEDKIMISARAFYEDNRDEYDSFDEALADFSSQKMSQGLIDFTVKANCQKEPGAHLIMSPGGHLANIFPHGFFKPITDIEEETIQMIFNAAKDVLGEKARPLECFLTAGWKEIKS